MQQLRIGKFFNLFKVTIYCSKVFPQQEQINKRVESMLLCASLNKDRLYNDREKEREGSQTNKARDENKIVGRRHCARVRKIDTDMKRQITQN